jgi:hypothetical protein
MSTGAEFILNKNISRLSLPASESLLFMAIYPTSRLALAPSHAYHAQASRSGSREFQFLGVILVERNRTHLHAFVELPTPTNRLAFASLFHRRMPISVCDEFPSGHSALHQEFDGVALLQHCRK